MTVLADTNIVIRYLIGDDVVQGAAAVLAASQAASIGVPLLVTEAVLCESVWVLESSYLLAPHDCAEALSEMLSTGGFVAWDSDLADSALRIHAASPWLDIVDCLLASRSEDAGVTVLTFDRGLRSLLGSRAEDL